MKRPLRPDELRVWVEVARTVEPGPGRVLPDLPAEPEPPLVAEAPRPVTAVKTLRRSAAAPPQPIEPGRHRRIVRERDDIDARIDLHGLTFERARDRLHDFLQRAHFSGARSVLVITGKGRGGDGVLRRHAPEWLAEPAVRGIVAGVSPAHRKHGGEGAFYVALKRG